jgi:exodeoxyribonuclease VII large subunit
LDSTSLVEREKVYTVTELTRIIKLELETSFPRVWVMGEVSNFHRHSSGHLYFTLKDEGAALRAAMFRAEARELKFELKDGLQILCRGRINVYEPRGEYQLVADLAEPKGKGALQLAFEQLKEKLRSEGLFDPAHKKKLPLLPKTIGVVTSPRGAAIVDILRTLERRFAKLHILIYPARVQGEGAADEIVEGIEYLGKLPDLDVLIVGRGGGSIEDLWAFNEEKVARAIFRCPIPVISAVGHEVDFTIADFVADVRASTPTAAAEMVIEKEEAFAERIDTLKRRAFECLRYAIQDGKHRVMTLAQHRIFQNFPIRLLNLEQQVDDLEERARKVLRGEKEKISEVKARTDLLYEKTANAIRRLLRDGLAAWERLTTGLNSRSPLDILKKGYALVWSADGRRAVTSIEAVRASDDVLVSFYKGEFSARVKSVDAERTVESRAVKDNA